MRIDEKIVQKYQQRRAERFKKHMDETPETVVASSAGDVLMKALYETVGNKVYLNDVEELFARIKLEDKESDALERLARDLKAMHHEAKKSY